MGDNRSQFQDGLVHSCDMILTGSTPCYLRHDGREDKVRDKPLGCSEGVGRT